MDIINPNSQLNNEITQLFSIKTNLFNIHFIETILLFTGISELVWITFE